jgi:hypothetical protein
MIGRPGRIGALDKFIDYAKGFPEVWFATRAEIAQWWLDNHPEPGPRLDDSKMALARRNGAR